MPSEGRRYQVQKVLGRGGFGTVYEAEMLSTGGFAKSVALKVLNQEVDSVEDVARRLRDEARLLGRLKHPNIVRVDDLVRLDGRWTVVMELLAGANLHQVLREAGPLPLGVAMEIVQAVAGALHAAHDRPGPEGHPMGVLHRDIKPSNVQLTPLGEVKVLDFGVARASFGGREAQTRSLIFGSVGYMAPERLTGHDSHAGDVYALGVVAYEVLAGRRLGTACSQARLQASMVDDAVDALCARLPDPDLRTLLTSSLAFEAEDRPRARAFQRLARAVRSRNPEPWLSDWAEEILAGVMPTLQPASGHLTGHVLCEAEGSAELVPPPEAPGEATAAPPTLESTPVPSASSPPLAPDAAARDAGPTRFDRVGLTPQPTQPAPTALEEVQATQASVPLPRERPAPGLPAASDAVGPSARPVRWPLAVGLGLASTVGVAALGAGLLVPSWFSPDEPAPADPAAAADAMPSDPPAAPAEPPASAPAPASASASASAPASAPASASASAPAPRRAAPHPAEPAPTDPLPSPAPVTAAPAAPAPLPDGPPMPPGGQAEVVVTGDALSVTLKGEAGAFGPGRLPPGRYSVVALFHDVDAEYVAGEVTLAPGQRAHLECTSDFGRCKLEGEPR